MNSSPQNQKVKLTVKPFAGWLNLRFGSWRLGWKGSFKISSLIPSLTIAVLVNSVDGTLDADLSRF